MNKHWTHPAVLAFVGTEKEYRLATLKEDVGGRFAKFKQGENVKVHLVKGVRWFSIEKIKRRKPKWSPLLNELCGVPKRILDFIEP